MGKHRRTQPVYCHPERKRAGFGLCGQCYRNIYFVENREKAYAQCRVRAREVKLEVLAHYSLKGYMSCSCPKCDIVEPDFLTIDHINGGGEKHRQSLGVGGSFYYWLKRNNFPLGFQTLCMNCNHATGRSFRNKDVCPHLRQPNSQPDILAPRG